MLSQFYVAVPPDRDLESTRKFGTFTRDLNSLAEWLGFCRIRTVAMESTGVYWIPLFQILEESGFTVYLVNAHYLKSVPGRKSDVSDCQWIQYLHSVGLLRTSFRPPEHICACSYIMAASSEPTPDGRRTYTSHPKGTESDECANSPCSERYYWFQRTGHTR